MTKRVGSPLCTVIGCTQPGVVPHVDSLGRRRPRCQRHAAQCEAAMKEMRNGGR